MLTTCNLRHNVTLVCLVFVRQLYICQQLYRLLRPPLPFLIFYAMPQVCSVCSKGCYANQSLIECSVCQGWVHHDNRLQCPGISDVEYFEHVQDSLKHFECEFCFTRRNAKEKNSFLTKLPFPIECEGNIFGKPPVTKSRPDVSSLTTEQLQKFTRQCESIQNQLWSSDNDTDIINNDDFISPSINSKYYDIKKFNSQVKTNPTSSFGLFHVNIASLNLHCDELRSVLSRLKYSFDIIGISEHKFTVGMGPFNNIDIPGYEFIFEPTQSNFGGTGFYIKNNLDYIIRDDLKINKKNDHEAIFIELILHNRKNLIVGCVYRHAGTKLALSDFNDYYLEPILEKISSEKKECALMGDFNVDLLKTFDKDNASHFYNGLSSYFFTPHILQPTRLGSKTLIDNIFFNSLEYSSISGNLLYELSDHLIQFLILEDLINYRVSIRSNLYKRDFSNFSEREFEETVINGINWNALLHSNANDSFAVFYNQIEYHLDEMAPYKKVTIKEHRLMQKPWITKTIIKRCNERDNILKLIREESNPNEIKFLREKYRVLRNKITAEKRSSKKNYFASQFERNKNKLSEIWKCIRSLVNLKPTKTPVLKLMEGGVLLSDPKDVSNIFNEHFSTLGSKVQQKIPSEKGSYMSFLQKKKNNRLIINPDGHAFFLSPVVPCEISNIINNLDDKKSTGPNGVPVFLLKTFKDFFSNMLSKLVNLSFENGVFPDMLKLAKVIPLHKKESKFNYVNYRPISLLSVFSKIYEKLIYCRIYTYLTKYNLIYPKQFGFRASHSTNHAIISITEHIRNLLDKGELVCGIFVDLEKAFDTVHHSIL